MDIIRSLGLGMQYSNNGKFISLILSFTISVFFRTLPVLLAIHYGLQWLALYAFPFWVGIELLLIGLFAFWGYLGILFSCIVTSMLHPLSLISPITLVTLEAFLILLQALTFWSNWFESLTEHSVLNYLLSILIPCLSAGLFVGIFNAMAGIHLGLFGCLEMLIISGQYFVAIFVCGYPSLILFSNRRSNPRGWISEWFLLLFSEGSSQCYPSSMPLEFNRGTPSQIHSNHQAQRSNHNNSDFVTINTNGEVLCPNCGTTNWPTRNRCRRCRTRL